jgi:ABC-type branched-subunit amino acid transport system substrate-binding protein
MRAGQRITDGTVVSIVAVIILCALVLLSPSFAQQLAGVTASQIDIGSCCPLTGGLAERGHQLLLGAQTYLQYVNEQGGINNRKIKLTQCDDRYDPDSAISCFNTCLKEKMLAGAFFVGSAPIAKYVRMADATGMPLLGFCSGTASIYEAHQAVFVLRRSYADEVKAQVRELYGRCGLRRYAIVYQNDSLGAAVRESAIQALDGYGARPLVEASYSRSAPEIEEAYRVIKSARPQVVILGANAEALKALIKKKKSDHWQALFVGLSVADDYMEELGKSADGAIVTQVVPLLSDDQLPAVKLFNKLHAKYDAKVAATNTAFEAFLNAYVFAESLKRCGVTVTRQGLVAALESLHDFDIGAGPNFKVSFSHANHVGWPAGSVYFTIVRGGRLSKMTDSDWSAVVKSLVEIK